MEKKISRQREMPRLESVTEQRQQNSSIVSIGGAHVSVNVQQCVTQFVHNKGVFKLAKEPHPSYVTCFKRKIGARKRYLTFFRQQVQKDSHQKFKSSRDFLAWETPDWNAH